MGKSGVTTLFSSILVVLVASSWLAEAKILPMCDAVRELKKGGISRTMMSNWICLMNSVSGMDTRLVRGPGTMSSFAYGIFQISSLTWCARGHSGGVCNKRCEDFADDNIQDDIVCAKIIVDRKGFQYWDPWMKKCKGKPLPNINNCKARRSLSLESFFDDVKALFSMDDKN